MPLTLANRITIFRIFCVPIFILLIIYYNTSVKHGIPNNLLRISAAIFFVGTVFLDALDGYIARTRNQITKLGTVIDPLADKALLISGLLLLSYPPQNAFQAHFPVWYLLLVISRDTILVLGAIIIHVLNGNVIVHPRISGKATTFFQMVLIAWILIDLPFNVFQYILWIASVLTMTSVIQYSLDGMRQLEKSGKDSN